MLTGKLVRVRYARDRILPYYLDVRDESWQQVAEQLLDMFRGIAGRSRGEVEEMIDETFGDDANTLVPRGLAKLLEDRCDFEVAAELPPEKLRLTLFREATAFRHGDALEEGHALPPFDRQAVLERAAAALGATPDEIDRSLFADLKSEARLVNFKDMSADRLLQRYNVALAQAVLLRATRVHVTINDEPPQRYRQLLRQLKFHRLLCEMERVGANSYALHIDGPLSLFSSTNKYGAQLAKYLPTVLLVKSFEVKAELRWGAQKKEKTFTITPKDKLVSHAADSGMWVPPELGMFVESFRKRIDDWELHEETEVYPLGNVFWVPDFRLVHKKSKKEVLLEVLGFWRKHQAERHLRFLQRFANRPFLLAVSDSLHIEEAGLEDLPAGVHRFRHMPLADEIARLAGERIGQ